MMSTNLHLFSGVTYYKLLNNPVWNVIIHYSGGVVNDSN